jgi:hypothetical protein
MMRRILVLVYNQDAWLSSSSSSSSSETKICDKELEALAIQYISSALIIDAVLIQFSTLFGMARGSCASWIGSDRLGSDACLPEFGAAIISCAIEPDGVVKLLGSRKTSRIGSVLERIHTVDIL